MPSSAPRVRSGAPRRLARVCRTHPWLVAGLVLSSVLGTGLEGLGPLLIGLGVTRVATGAGPPVELLVSVLLALAAVQFGAEFARRYLAGKLALSVQHRLRSDLFSSLQRYDGVQQDRLSTGQVVSRANSDLQQVQAMMGMLAIPIGVLSLFVVAATAMFWQSWPLALVTMTIVPLLGVVVARSRRQIGPISRLAAGQQAVIADQVEQTVSGVQVVAGFGQEEREVERLSEKAIRLYRIRVRLARLQAFFAASMAALPALGQVGILGLGGWLALRGSIEIGTFIAFAGYLVLLTAPTRLLANFTVTWQQTIPALERVFELIDADPTITEDPHADPVPDGPTGVALQRVSFSYPGSADLLREVDLQVAPGETVAVVGPAGSGKSTVALLLSRFYDPDAGSVLIGPEDGLRDVRELRLSSVRSSVATVMEEPLLFSGTLRDNLVYGSPRATPEQISRAVECAGLTEVVDGLPDGLDTVVGERGSGLSGGQRQRVALARALLCEPSVLVLDDATSAVDASTEARIVAALAEQSSERATVLVARRAATLRHVDRVVLLDDGRVVDQGDPHEVARRSELFRAVIEGSDADLAGADHGPQPGITATLWPEPDEPESQPAVDDIPLPPPVPQTDRLRGLVRPVRWILLAALVFLAVDMLAGIALPRLVQRGIDVGVGEDRPEVLTQSVLIAAALVVVGWVAVVCQTRLLRRAGEQVLMGLRVRSYAHVQRLGIPFVEQHTSGAIMTRVVNDVDALTMFLQGGLLISIGAVAMLVGVCVALLTTDLALGAAALALLPVVLIATAVFYRLSRRAYDEARNRIGEVNSGLQERVRGVRTAQSFTAESRQQEQVDELSERYREARLRAQRYSSIFFPSISLVGAVSRAVVLAVGARLIGSGEATVGTLAAVLLYLGMLFGPLQQLSQAFDSFQQASVGVRRIRQLLATEPTVRVDPGAREAPARIPGALQFDGVGFGYRGAETLRSLDLHVPAGRTVALVGPTGAGKSTALKLAARFYDPAEGRICLDGREIRQWTPATYRRRIGYVPQEPFLFDGDIAENIRYGRPEATDAEVEEVARRSGALEVARRQPRGFRQPVGKSGESLSAGERQLIAMARAALVRPDLLLLDEATSALDADAERAVSRATRGEHATLLVAHRLQTAAAADRIVVLRDGELCEQGSHAELLAADGWYAEAWRAQQREADPVDS